VIRAYSKLKLDEIGWEGEAPLACIIPPNLTLSLSIVNISLQGWYTHTFEAQFFGDHYRPGPSDIVALRKSAFTTTFEQPQRAGPEK